MSALSDLRAALIDLLAERFNRLPGQCGGHADALIEEVIWPWLRQLATDTAEEDQS